MKLTLKLLFIAFSGLIVWAVFKKPLSESGTMLISDPWGIVTLVDLYLGFLLTIFFIFLIERSKLRAVIWSSALLILGNGISILFILVNYKTIVKKLKS